MDQTEIMRNSFYGLLRDNFRSGFDPASIIDRKKFSRAICALAKLESFEPAETLLRKEAGRVCFEWEGKFYAIDNKAQEYLSSLIETLQQEGSNLINVKVLFKKFGVDFLKLGIISPELLKEYLCQKLGIGEISNFLRLDPTKDVASEFAEKLTDVNYLPQRDVAELFPYLLGADVAQWAAEILHYEPLRNGDLYLPSAIEFDEIEWQREIAKIKRAITEQGYFFYRQLNLNRTRANYEDLPEAVFKGVLEKKLNESNLTLKGQIISSVSAKKQLSKIIADYCTNQERFSFREIQIIFGGHIPTSYSSWLNSICIKNSLQIDFDNFISFRSINFDVEAIDSCLDSLFGYRPFTVSSFNKYYFLPSIDNYRWNKYIFMNYLINFSRDYKFVQPSFNRKCIGIAYHFSTNYISYHALAAQMAIDANVPANQDRLVEYLLNEGIYVNCVPDAITRILKIMAG